MKDQQFHFLTKFECLIYQLLQSQQLLLINKDIILKNEDGHRMDMGINIGDESQTDVAFAPFLSQSFHQVISPLLNNDIIT
jgi:hypothetical protein